LQIADLRSIENRQFKIQNCKLASGRASWGFSIFDFELQVCVQSAIGNPKSAITNAAHPWFYWKNRPSRKSLHFPEELDRSLRTSSVQYSPAISSPKHLSRIMNSKNSLRRLLNDALGRRKENGRRGRHRRLALETQLEVRAMLTPVTHFHADFRDAGAPSLDGFTIENSIGAPVDGLWHLSTAKGFVGGHTFGGSMYFGTGEADPISGNYDVGHTAGRITSPAINSIPAGAVLSFNYFLHKELDIGFDVPSVLISANSGPFIDQSISLNPDSQGFLIASLDLSAFRGQNIQVRFQFDTIDGQGNGFEGWYVDDVMVTTGTRNIQGTVFNDVNDNDILDGDPGFPDTRVFIDDDNDGVYDTDYFVRNPSNATPVAIPDESTVTSTITIGGSALELVRDVNVTLDITHSWNEDLDVFLIAPNGTRVELFTDVGDGVANFT
jgi:hypothetical protein